MNSLSTIDQVFHAVQAAAHNLRPILRRVADLLDAQCAAIKDSMATAITPAAAAGAVATSDGSGGPIPRSGDAALAEVELQVALRSALAYLEKAHSDAGPQLFFRRGSLGYELVQVVRGLQHAADHAYAAGLCTHNPHLDPDTSAVIASLTNIEARLHTDFDRLRQDHGGDLDAILAESEHLPLTTALLRAALLAQDPPGLIQRRLTDDVATRDMFELHYDDVDIDTKQVTNKGGQVCAEKVSIGSDANGQIYKGRYLGVPVAVKEFRSAAGSEPFESKVAMLCALRHPNIVPLIGFTRGDRVEGSKDALITPLPVKSLTDAIADPGRSAQQTKLRWRWCVDIASALVYLHQRHPPIRHGDLNPANVMIDADGNALLNFGLTTSGVTSTLHAHACTPAYAAPEVQEGGGPTTAADVFALGLVLYEVWHGRPWFDGIDLRGHASHEAFLRAGLLPPVSPQAIPAFASSLISQCLMTKPSDRLSSAEVLQRILWAAVAASTALSGAAARRAETLDEGDPTPFNPLSDNYTPRVSAIAAFEALMVADPPARVQQLVAAIQLKTIKVLRDVGTARRQSEDEVFAIVAYTSDVRSIGLNIERNVWRRLNTILHRRDLNGFPPFEDYYWYLTQGLSKVPLESPADVWRGLSNTTLEMLGSRYAEGRRVCFVSFTSTSTLNGVMKDFAIGAASVMLRIEACEGRSLRPYSLVPNEAEVMLAPNALCEVIVVVPQKEVATVASFPGGERLPKDTALITLKQLPTPIAVIGVTTRIAWRIMRSAQNASTLSAAEKAAVHVISDAHGTFEILAAICGHVQHLRVDATCNAEVASAIQTCSTLLSLQLERTTDLGIHGLELIPTLEELNLSGCAQATNVSCLRTCRALRILNLKGTDVTDAGIRGLELIPTLEVLDLSWCQKVTNVSCLETCRALRKLDLAHSNVTDAGIRGLETIPALEELSLSGCAQATNVSCLETCRALRKLDLSGTGVTDVGLHGLERILRLEELTLAHCKHTTDVSRLGCFPALRKLCLKGTHVTDAGIVGLGHIRKLEQLSLHGCRQVTDVSCLQHCRTLRHLDLSKSHVTDAGICKLAFIPTLEDLDLSDCVNTGSVNCLEKCRALRKLNLSCRRITHADMRALELISGLQNLALHGCELEVEVGGWLNLYRQRAVTLQNCRALKTVNLSRSSITDAGIRGLELIPTLEELDLHDCMRITDVSCLRESVALRKIDLSNSSVPDSGIRGLELIPTLQELNISGCQQITDVSCLRGCQVLRELDLSKSSVTNAGLRGLELIPTLEKLILAGCVGATDVTYLRYCRKLIKLDLSRSGISRLDCIPTLQELNLSDCKQITDVSYLRNCPTLRTLDLSGTTASIGGLSFHMPKLEEIRLFRCRATDFNWLHHCPGIRKVGLSKGSAPGDVICGLELIPKLELDISG
jgi:serine/threonine protein kinase/Leucine-rich repeat (LRR) protein